MVEAAEVVVTLGDSIVSVTRVEPGAAYWIGTAPGVDLAVRIGVTRWPLVESSDRGLIVRDPHATGHDRVLGANDVISVPLASAVAHVMPIGAVPRIPLRGAELRPWIYGAVVLALHLLVCLCAELAWRPEKLVATKPPPRIVHIAHAPTAVPPPPARTRIVDTKASKDIASKPTKRLAGAKANGTGGAAGDDGASGSWGNIGALVSKLDVKGLVNDSVAYDEEGAKQTQFGNHGGGFAPCKHMDCSSVALKRYTVQMTEQSSGASYELPGVKAVPPHVAVSTPSVTGSVKSAVIQRAVAQRDAALQECLTQFSSQSKGSLRVDILIDRSGGVGINGLKGHNDQRAKDCVADVVRGVVLDGSYADETTASVQIAFAFPK